jgi:hypothetical protein
MTDTGGREQPEHAEQPEQAPANWYPDPFGRHELRYWDGAQWTEHVSSHGRQSTDAPVGSGNVPTVKRSTEKVVRDVAKAGADTGFQGGGTIFTEPVLVVNQKAKFIEMVNEYGVFDQNGNQLGFVAEVGQSAAKKIARFVSSLDQFMTHTYEIRDADQQPQLVMTRPRKIMKSSFVVTRPDGSEVGQIKQQNVIGKAGSRSRPAGSRSASSTPRTGAPGTSTSRTARARRSPA